MENMNTDVKDCKGLRTVKGNMYSYRDTVTLRSVY